MTEAYRKLLAAAGLYELVLGVRLGVFGDLESRDMPLYDLSLAELEDCVDRAWEMLLKPQEEGPGLFEMGRRLALSEEELHLVLLASLRWLHADLGPLLMKIKAAGGALSLGCVRLLMEAAGRYPEEEPRPDGGWYPEEEARPDGGRLHRFALFDVYSGERWQQLDAVMAAHFTAGDTTPLWWELGVSWSRQRDKEREVLGDMRRELAARVAGYLRDGKGPVYLDGQLGSGRRTLAWQIAELLGKDLLVAKLLPEVLAQKDAPKILVRETLLVQGVLAAVPVPEAEQEEIRVFLQELLYRCRKEGVPLLVLGNGGHALGAFVEICGPDREERRQLWAFMSRRMRLAPDVSLEELADRYELLPGQIFSILKLAREQAELAQCETIDRALLFSCCHRCLRRDMGGRAVPVPVRFSWEDLLLEKKQKDKLVRAEEQIRYHYQVFEEWGLKEKQPYGRGISLVFSGPPGTGKTMAAQVLAGRIGMELYRVELPSVVSRYIGETEKNLDQIFENARKAQVVLFFDEADVLFAKRTDVRDSNDKYSNMEAAFLLQKMEAYNGVTILATNLLRNMDEAFKRRMRALVEFPFPDRYWRGRIWEKAFPERLPLKTDIDLGFMASAFELSGAGIRNVVMGAAFLAASEKEALGMSQLVRAAKDELEKNGKTMAPEELGPYGMYLEEASDV